MIKVFKNPVSFKLRTEAETSYRKHDQCFVTDSAFGSYLFYLLVYRGRK